MSRTKALSIPREVKRAVADRDSCEGWACCVLCGRPAPTENPLAYSCAHYIGRAQGGLGVVENIVTLCPDCHRAYDNSPQRAEIKRVLYSYLRTMHPDIDETKLVYRK